MKKKTAIDMLGGTPKKAAEALGYTAVQAIYMWSDPLPQAIADRVRGAAARLQQQKADDASAAAAVVAKSTEAA